MNLFRIPISRTLHVTRTLCTLVNHLGSKRLQKSDATRIILDAKKRSNLSFEDLSQRLKVNKVWLVSAILGQHPMKIEISNRLMQALNITGSVEELEALTEVLSEIPSDRCEVTSKDPVIRRYEELIDVYGESIKTIIREEAGDGIMSAINCTLQLHKSINPQSGEVRIVLTVDGKYLAYTVNHHNK